MSTGSCGGQKDGLLPINISLSKIDIRTYPRLLSQNLSKIALCLILPQSVCGYFLERVDNLERLPLFPHRWQLFQCQLLLVP